MTSFWDISRPAKPVGLFDINSTRRIQLDWSDWLAQEETAYSSHEIIPDAPFTVIDTSFIDGTVVAYLRVAPGGSAVIGQKYNIVCRMTTTDGQIEDQTVLLKAVHK